MANFNTHISASTILGVVYGTVAYTQFEVPLGHCFVAGSKNWVLRLSKWFLSRAFSTC